MTQKSQANAQLTDLRSLGVVLLHGIARPSRSLRTIERALQARGFAALNRDHPSAFDPLSAPPGPQ